MHENSTEYAKGWYIAVEFFFIVSGYLLAQRSERGSTGYDWVKSLLIKIFPYNLLILLLNFLIYLLSGEIDKIVKAWPELLMIHMSGINFNHLVNAPAWYVSALLISGYIIIELRNNCQWFVDKIIAPIMPLFIYAYIYQNNGYLDIWIKWNGFTTFAILRSVAGLCIGINIFNIAKVVNIKNDNRLRNMMISSTLLSASLLISFVKAYTWVDFLLVIIMAIGIYFSFIDRNYNDKTIIIFAALGKMSLPIFLSHTFILKIFIRLFANMYKIEIYFLFLISVFFFSMVTYYYCDSIVSKVRCHFTERSEQC